MFTPTRVAARQRLRAFLPRAGTHYERRRNFDLGPKERENVSCLSPWIRHRLLLEAEVAQAALAAHGSDADKFIDEVFWRTYFRGWMAHHPGVWTRYGESVQAAREALAADSGLAERVTAAEAGRTGNAAFDHWARELVTTGYLHNHARMWFASIWVFTLRLPWVLGADFFLRHLLDGDPASNTLSWRWVCGLHTRGKTYLARRDNILRFTEGRLDPGPGLAQQAEPLQEPGLSQDATISWPEPPLPGGRRSWLVTEDDCRVETARVPRGAALATLQCAAARSPGAVAEPVRAFTRGALADAAQRAEAEDAPAFSADAPEPLIEWAVSAGLDALDVMHAPYGPAADTLARLRPTLAEAGIRLQTHVRGWDRRAWPHANRGFFRLRKRIPALLEAAGAAEPADA